MGVQGGGGLFEGCRRLVGGLWRVFGGLLEGCGGLLEGCGGLQVRKVVHSGLAEGPGALYMAVEHC